MKRLLAILAITLQPAYAGSIAEGTAPIIYFRYHDPAYPVVACMKPENIPASDGPWFPFDPETYPDRTAQHYKFASGALVYSPPPPPIDPPPAPNPDAFIDQVAADPTINTGSFLIALKVARIKDAAARQAAWQAHSGNIPPPQRSAIENAAAANYFPLR